MQTNLNDMIKDVEAQKERERLEIRKIKDLYRNVRQARTIDAQEIAQQKLDNYLFKKPKYKGYAL